MRPTPGWMSTRCGWSARESSYAEETRGGIPLITHYTRILRYIQPQFVHVFVGGRFIESGGPELADELDANGYERFSQAAVAEA